MPKADEGVHRVGRRPWRGRLITVGVLAAVGLPAVMADSSLSGELCQPACYVATPEAGEEPSPPPGFDYFDATTGCWTSCPP